MTIDFFVECSAQKSTSSIFLFFSILSAFRIFSKIHPNNYSRAPSKIAAPPTLTAGPQCTARTGSCTGT